MYDTGPDPFCGPDDIHGDTSNQRKEKKAGVDHRNAQPAGG